MPNLIGNASLNGDGGPGVRRVSRIGFMQRMGPVTRIAIRQASKTDPLIEDFLDLLSASELIELDHPDTLMGVGYIVGEGLMTQAEGENLLA